MLNNKLSLVLHNQTEIMDYREIIKFSINKILENLAKKLDTAPSYKNSNKIISNLIKKYKSFSKF